MNISKVLTICNLISNGSKKLLSKKEGRMLRKSILSPSISKVAFDTRRIDQEETFNPRRGLQNYHRSQPFISDNAQLKIQAFTKLSLVLEELKTQYKKDFAYQDSYLRILHSAIQKGLRIKEGDQDYSEVQPSVSSLDYLDELMYVRYRLTCDAILNSDNDSLKKIIMAKDPQLTSDHIPLETVSYEQPLNLKNINGNNDSYMLEKVLSSLAQMMVKMKQPDDLTTQLFNIKATNDNPNVERTVTIKINESLNKSEPSNNEVINE